MLNLSIHRIEPAMLFIEKFNDFRSRLPHDHISCKIYKWKLYIIGNKEI